MLKNLNPTALSVSGRLSEVIEATLSTGFRSLDLDSQILVRRAEGRGSDLQWQLVLSAKIKVGEWDLPVRWQGDEAQFQADLARLPKVAELAASIEATRCHTLVQAAGTGQRPYQESFELHRQRLTQVGEALAQHGVRLGLAFQAAARHIQDKPYPLFNTAEALAALVQTIGLANVGFALDTWNWHVGGGTLDQIKALPADKLVAVRLADLPLEADLAKVTERDRLLPRTTGVVPNEGLVEHLQALDYPGPVGPVPHPSRLTGQPRERLLREAAKSIDGQTYDAPPPPPLSRTEEEELVAGAASLGE